LTTNLIVRLEKYNKLKYDIEYFEGITAPYIDWVGGGNFDGYLVQKYLKFIEHNNRVELHTKVIDKTRYDNNIEDSVIIGSFNHSDKDTITLTFEHFQMRGKVLGEKNELIAFDIWNTSLKRTEVYKINE
jgi:hypothetical protein